MTQRLQVGIDLSLKYNEVYLVSDQGHTLAQRRFRHNWPGFQALVSCLKSTLQAGDYAGLDIAAEATGLLWFHLFYHLAHTADLAGCIYSTPVSSRPSSAPWPSGISVTPKTLR